jgi:hypothetical protein
MPLRKKMRKTRKIHGNRRVKKMKGGSLKIAILLSGRIAGYENVENNLQNIVKKYQPVFFVSLNKKIKSPYIDTFCKKYNIDDDRLYLEKVNTPQYIYTLKGHPLTYIEGTYSMFYNNYCAFKLLETYQTKHKMQFDCILLYRAEMDSSELIQLNIPEKNTIYIPEGDDYDGLNGIIAYGDYNSMKNYCNLVNSIEIMCKEQNVLYIPEVLVQKNIEFAKLNVQRFKYKYILHASRKNHVEYNLYE